MFGSINDLVGTGSTAAGDIFETVFGTIEDLVGKGFGSLGDIIGAGK